MGYFFCVEEGKTFEFLKFANIKKIARYRKEKKLWNQQNLKKI